MPVCLLTVAESVSHAMHTRLVEVHSDRSFSILKLNTELATVMKVIPRDFPLQKKSFVFFAIFSFSFLCPYTTFMLFSGAAFLIEKDEIWIQYSENSYLDKICNKTNTTSN